MVYLPHAHSRPWRTGFSHEEQVVGGKTGLYTQSGYLGYRIFYFIFIFQGKGGKEKKKKKTLNCKLI